MEETQLKTSFPGNWPTFALHVRNLGSIFPTTGRRKPTHFCTREYSWPMVTLKLIMCGKKIPQVVCGFPKEVAWIPTAFNTVSSSKLQRKNLRYVGLYSGGQNLTPFQEGPLRKLFPSDSKCTACVIGLRYNGQGRVRVRSAWVLCAQLTR